MVLSTGVAHAVDCDCRIVPPRLVKPKQCELEAGLQQALEALVGGRVTELAWKRETCPRALDSLRAGPVGGALAATNWATYHAHRLIAHAGGNADMERSTTMCKSQRKHSRRKDVLYRSLRCGSLVSCDRTESTSACGSRTLKGALTAPRSVDVPR